jgi:hypothetical protein
VRRAAGLTLVEIMVAMLLVLAVIAGSTAFVTRGRAAHRTSESLARIEESLDAGLALITEEVRLAGYLGLAPPGSLVDGASPLGTGERADLAVAGNCGISLAHDLSFPIAGADAGYASAPARPLGCRAAPDGRHVPASDTLVVRHASADPSPAQAGRLQLETNLRNARLAADGSAALGDFSRRHALEVSVFYVSSDSTGRRDWPSLRRKRLVGGVRPAFQDEELVSGIADLQVSVGLDDLADIDGAVDRWIAIGESMGAATPRALRVELEARSEVPEQDQPDMSRRKRVARVIELRNSGVPR